MSETISTTFTADSDAFTAEVKKAQATIDQLAGKSLPLMERNMNDAFFAAQKTSKAMNQLQQSTQSTGGGLLQLAYFADDAQYGLKGIMNNIPGLLQGFGAGMGLAGVVSIAALALAKLGPGLASVTGLTNNHEKSLRAVNSQMANLLASYTNETNAIKIKAASLKAEIELYEQREKIISQLSQGPVTTGAEKQIEHLKQQTDHTNQLIAARAKLASIVQPKDPTTQGNIAQNEAELTAKENAKAIQEEIAARRKLQEELAAQKVSQANAASAEVAAVVAEKNANETLIETLEKKLRLKKLQAEGAETIIKGIEKGGLVNAEDGTYDLTAIEKNNVLAMGAKNLAYLWKDGGKKVDLSGIVDAGKQATAAAAELEKELSAAKAQAAQIAAQQKSLTSGVEQAQSAYETELKTQGEIVRQLEKKLQQQRELKSITDQILTAEQKAALEAEKTAAAEKAKTEAAKAQAEAKRQAAEAERTAAIAKDQKTSLTETQAELAAMRAQAAGNKKLADEIRARIAIAQQARQIASATGVSEKQALEIAKEKHKLQQQIDGQKTNNGDGSRDGRIRLFRAGESPTSLQRGTGAAARKAQDFQRRTQAWMENPMRTKSAVDQVATDQLKTQQRLLQIWEKNLGLI